ncbi:hypothetical protein BJV82DRAFT_190854 [Fennellomyces sp. T-0311]|nr:hypothetical protein BJV82DRAFT_190854 [Fennellomyces sp. T-0311]
MRRFTISASSGKPADPRHHDHIKVIVRCTIYSLVPFLVYIWGFVIQIMVAVNSNVPYKLTMTSMVFSSAEGLLTSLVFFSEPVIVNYARQKMADIHRSYVDEFSVLEISDNGGRIRRQGGRHDSIASNQSVPSHCTNGTAYASNLFDKRNLVPRSATVEKEYHSQIDLGDTTALAPPLSTSSEERTHSIDSSAETRSIPMRRVSVSSSVYSRIRDEYERRRSEESNISTLVNDESVGMVPSPDTPDEVFIPYRSPALATMAHWLIVRLDRLRGPFRSSGDNESSIPSIDYTNRMTHSNSSAPEVHVETPSVPSTASHTQ